MEAIGLVLKEHRVDGLLSVTWEKQVEQTTQYGGGGRGSMSREKRVLQKTRYHITHIARQAATSAARRQRLGWKAFVTNAEQKRLSLQDAVLCYRNEYRVECIFNRLKRRVHIAPLFVKLNAHIDGLTYLLTLSVRGLTVMIYPTINLWIQMWTVARARNASQQAARRSQRTIQRRSCC